MAGRLAVDFGTSNTVVALWDEAAREGRPLAVPDYAHQFVHNDESTPVIPSLIHYADGDRLLVGDQVRRANVTQAPATFKWMKRYIAHRSPVRTRVNGHEISYFDAGRDFLTAILAFAAVEADIGDEEIALTVPVEAYEHYDEWLAQVASHAGMPRFRLIDEPSAAALGYGASVQPGNAYLLFDFGGGTLDVAVVLIEDDSQTPSGRPPTRVLGKAGADLGGATLDGWLFAEVLRRAGLRDSDEEVRPLSRVLLAECERAKERLSTHARAEVSVLHPRTGSVAIGAELTREDFEGLLEGHEAYTTLDRTIRRALREARERGYDEDGIAGVLMVGGSSLVPSVQRTLQRIFGRDRVFLGRPLDAVARGAAAFVAGVDFYDHIQHDYAIRWLNPETGDYDYRVFLRAGTPYPTGDPVARLTVKATYDGQATMGVAVFELGDDRRHRPAAGLVDLVFDPSGAARLTPITAEDEEHRTHFWVNEPSPTFLAADPPGRKGEQCFAIEFGVDGNKRLLLTARDLRTGRLTHRDYPVVKLT